MIHDKVAKYEARLARQAWREERENRDDKTSGRDRREPVAYWILIWEIMRMSEHMDKLTAAVTRNTASTDAAVAAMAAGGGGDDAAGVTAAADTINANSDKLDAAVAPVVPPVEPPVEEPPVEEVPAEAMSFSSRRSRS